MGDKDKSKSGSTSKSKTKSRYRRSSRDVLEEGMGKAKTEGHLSGKERKKRERWLLTRKTWRYMADAGRKLIPEGAHNRPEDIPKIEAYFQEVCHREPRFLLWRKQSYPGALGFRNRGRSRGGRRKIGGSCRDKTSSADEADDIKYQQNVNQTQQKQIARPTLLQLKQEFLFGKTDEESPKNPTKDALVDNVLSHFGDGSSKTLDHQELLDRLTAHLASIELKESHRARSDVQSDSTQQKLIETLRRYYSRSTNRDKVISDILTDRRLLHRLYFELRRTRGFIGGRPGTSSSTTSAGTSTDFGTTLRSGRWRRSELVEEDEDAEAEDEASPWSSPPEAMLSPGFKELDRGTQTEPIPTAVLSAIEEEVKKQNEARRLQELQELQLQQQQDGGKQSGRRSSVDNDDISPSVSDTIKRYLRMARKKSVDSDKIDRFKRVNYDRTLRNIKPRPEDPISKDEDTDKGCQTEDTWVSAIKQLKLPEIPPQVQQEEVWSDTSPPPTSKSFLSSGQTFLSNLLHGLHHSSSSSSVTAAGAMQKSKSSSSVVHQGTRLVARKMWKSRSKSQTRATPTATSTWTPQGNCVWTNVTGRTVMLEDTPLLQLTDIERRVLQKVALAKLQALNLGVAIRTPSETATSSVQKPKRRAHLLKRKAITTGFFDTNRKEPDKDKGEGGGGLVFGIPLGQCVENEKAARLRAGPGDETNQLRRKSQYGSRTSFTSLIETPRSGEEKGSCESLISPTLSMPGLLDSLSCGSTQDLTSSEGSVPNIVATCLQHLEMHGLHTLGIFRVSSSKKRVRQLREDFDCGKEASLDAELCPHDVATLLKEYFRDLPDSLLCKDLYPAFIQTQRIRNRRLQHEALQNLLFLLPVPNRDTLWALLNLLSLVASNSSDHKDSTSGEWTLGNKMDSNNLATLFAPNILHSCSNNKSLKDEMSAERSEERADAINVVRSLIDNYRELYQVSAEVIDEVYVHMMDSHPELLDVLLRRRDAQTEELGDEQEVSLVSDDITDRLASNIGGDSDDHVSNEDVRITRERRVWSREAFTHETAGMGGPDLEVRPRHKERGRERVLKKRREESSTRRRLDSDTGSNTPSRRASTGQGSEDYSSDHINSSRGSLDSGAITAVLKIPVPASTSLALNLDDSDIPFIEDNERQQISLSMVRTTSSSSQRTRSHSGSDSSQASTQIHQIQYQALPGGPGYDSAVGSSAALSSPPRITTPSASSYSSGGVYSSPPSWASTPPTSPDGLITTVNYIPEEPTTARISIPTKKSTDSRQVILQRVTVRSAGEVQHVKSSYIQPTAAPEPARRRSKEGMYQRLHSTGSDSTKVTKSASSSSIISYPNERIIPIVKEGDRVPSTDRKVTTSISNIGGAVLRSKTADIERMIKVNANINTSTSKSQTVKKVTTTTSNISPLEKEDDKKQTKRRYTDVRHQTRHLTTDVQSETSTSEPTPSSTQTVEPKRAVVWKRREIISSEPKERRSYV